MGATPFVAMDWTPHQVITNDQMDQMQVNLQWLVDNTPRTRFVAYPNTINDTMTAVVSGKVYVPRSKYNHIGYGHVKFSSVFQPGTAPNVTTGIISDKQRQVWAVVRGINGALLPDYRGFDININVPDISTRPKKVKGKVQHDKLARQIWVSWIAVGKAKS